MSTAARKLATYAYVLAAPSDVVAEIIVFAFLATNGPTSCELTFARRRGSRIEGCASTCTRVASGWRDVSVVCGPQAMSPIDPHALTNPTILVEVTSRSTEDYDRGDKLSHYKQLPSLRAVLFVSHRERRVTVIRRGAEGWEEDERRAGERVVLGEPQLDFAIDDLYAGIELDPK